MFKSAADGIRGWLVSLFASAIKHATRPEDRVLAIQWLGQSRDIVASDLRSVEKFKKLNDLINSRTALKAIAGSVSEAITNYRKANLPLSLKIAIPATLAALPLVGGQGAGIAAFGGAIGLPVLLLIFLGAAGITSIIEAVVTSPEARPHISEIIDIILEDERLRRASAEMKTAMKQQPTDAMRYDVPTEEIALRKHLLEMDPFHFEKHIVSFFEAAGLEAWATRKSNDMGADGFAVHDHGLLVIQCKRNAIDNKIGRPTINNLKESSKNMERCVVTSSQHPRLQKKQKNLPK
jgi:restriction system protein